MIVYGVIPGPKEPKGTMNTYLEMIVDELQTLWRGVHVDYPSRKWQKRSGLGLL